MPLRHAAEVGERAHVAVEKAGLVLPRVEPREVAARVHQPHHEHPGLDHRARQLDEHLEEVDLRQVAGRVHQRHEHLAPSALPLRDRLLDRRHADREPLGQEHPVQPGGRQPLLAAGPLRRLGQKRLEPGAGLLPDRTAARHPLDPHRRRLRQVPLHRVARDPHLPGHPPGRQALHQHLVPNHMNLIHPQHPPRGRTRDVDAGWISFRAAFGSLSGRRDHLRRTSRQTPATRFARASSASFFIARTRAFAASASRVTSASASTISSCLRLAS